VSRRDQKTETAIRATGADGQSSDGTRITPIRILSVAAVLLLVFIVFAPQQRPDAGSSYSSYAVGASGTRALYEVLARIGFAVSRNEKPLTSSPDSASTYVLIAPAQPLTAVENNHLLGAVRRGAILVFTPDDGSLVDSLGFEPASPPRGFNTLSQTTVAGGNPPSPEAPASSTIFENVFPIAVTVASKAGFDSQAFLWLDAAAPGSKDDSAQHPTLVLGHRFGRGYAIAVAPAPIITNQLMRDPNAAIAITRAIQFADSSLASFSRSNVVVFDEYHHGYGTHADMIGAVERGLTTTSVGRMTVQFIAAALVLLLAYGVRPLAPASVPTPSRRSPLEHVGALAHAYLHVRAHKLGANRLVRGLRRRHSLGLPGSLPDPVYLTALRTRVPGVSADVDRILTALAPDSPDSSDHFAITSAAVANIERTFQK
jgi:hypothetical protein